MTLNSLFHLGRFLSSLFFKNPNPSIYLLISEKEEGREGWREGRRGILKSINIFLPDDIFIDFKEKGRKGGRVESEKKTERERLM